MDHAERVRSAIRDIANKRNNVAVEEIEWVVSQLANYHSVTRKEGPHGVRFRVDGQRFGVCTHHRGSKQVKACYVDDFVSAMIELGWFDEMEG